MAPARKPICKPLVIEDCPIPEPGEGEVLVKIEASGLCHTDMHAANGNWPVKPTPPLYQVTRASASRCASEPEIPG
jgi:D-arabinose 1-dehydrogenase-like Zn-dependent alcohol dehydrogenase